MTRARLVMFVISGACLLSSLTVLAQLLSPGELAKPHQKLEGDDKCLECHSSGRKVETSRCTKCHADIGAELVQHRGLHGREYASKPCADCHVEHRGVAHELVRWPGGSRERFDHRITGFALEGGHREIRCADCHKGRNARGAPTLLGVQTTCASCHEDPHQQRFGNECRTCHNDRTWREVTLTGFDHDSARFKLKGEHRRVECAKCHGTPAQYRELAFETCTSCHKDPHRGSFGTTCTSCHSEASWKELHMRRSAHPGLSLEHGHARVACATCHDRGVSAAPSKGSRCVSCHEPVHEAKFGRQCNECHERIEWLGLPDELGRSVHKRTAFPLRGSHQQVECAECHDPKRPAQARFRELVFDRCTGCHEDAHRGEFSARADGECSSCHDEHGFRPALFDVKHHASTAFPLEGAHMAVACTDCHGQKRPRVDFHLDKRACAECHENPHGTEFADEIRAGGCEHCHSAKDWHEPHIDHSTWPLTGAHSLALCSACHQPSAEDKRTGRGASYRGVPRDCQGCHEDPHLGQFRLTKPVRECAECHDTTRFELPHFDHAQKTGYALEGEHEHVTCVGCHPTERLRDGATATRFRLTYRRCSDCHANPHEQAPR